jgi:PAS domain S-box-containing protein
MTEKTQHAVRLFPALPLLGAAIPALALIVAAILGDSVTPLGSFVAGFGVLVTTALGAFFHYRGQAREHEREVARCAEERQAHEQEIEEFRAEAERTCKDLLNGDLGARLRSEALQPAHRSALETVNRIMDVMGQVIDNTPMPVISTTPDCKIKFISRAAETLTGQTRQALAGRHCGEIIKTGDCAAGNCAHKKALVSGKSELGRTDVNTGGKTIKASYVCVPMKHGDGQIASVQNYILDQTNRVTAEAKVKRLMQYQDHETKELSTLLAKLAQGDLTVRYKPTAGDEETAEIARAFTAMSESLNTSLANLGQTLRRMLDNSTTLASGSEELTAVTKSLAGAAQSVTQKASGIAAGTEEMSVNISTMAAATEQVSVNVSNVSAAAEEMSVNMSTVASAVEEMTTSIRDISGNVQSALTVSRHATDLSKNMTERMNALGGAAKAIGKVTDVIKHIAEQTNLLALNATIEAASAGDAGRGFAVVANEIKELAAQSAGAADDIAEKVEGIRNNTSDAVTIITEVAQIIDRIGSSVQSIAQQIEQQSKAANEISRNVHQASNGVRSTATSISEISAGATDVSKHTGEAARSATDMADSAKQIKSASESSLREYQQLQGLALDLAKVAGDLQAFGARFSV